MSASRTSARSALRVILFSAVLGWGFFVAANYADLVVESGLSGEELYGPDAVPFVRPSYYLIFAAIAVFALGSLFEKKKLQQLVGNSSHNTPLANPAHEFATTAVIISLVLAAVAAISVFLESFSQSSDDIDVPIRVLNSYLPIVLYTALTIFVLLFAFVFNRPSAPDHRVMDSNPAIDTASATEPNSRELNPAARRSVALSSTIPIVAVAVALIFGLIVYDLTQTALEVWIWVLIQAFIAAGIIVGVFYAKQSTQPLVSPNGPVAGASVGARQLNFVLSIIFSAVAAFMSLGYGASAVEQLRVQPSLSISAYADATPEFLDSSQPVNPKSITVMASGYDLQRKSTADVVLEPGSLPIASADVDADGYLNAEGDFPTGVDAGDYSLTVRAESTDGTELKLAVEVVIDDEGKVTFPLGTDAYSNEQAATVMPASLGWVISDLLPALLLLLLAISTIYATLTVRHRDLETLMG